MTSAAESLVLASGSAARRLLLEKAGVPHGVETAGVDEEAVKASLLAEGAEPGIIAETLAELKAQKVSRRHAGKLVIGADQTLDCQGRLYDKPENTQAARRQLLELAGKEHRLTSALVVVRDGTRLWHHRSEARLVCRNFDEPFVDAYLEAAGPEVLQSVGAYQIEGRGIQLFREIRGDHFTIMGLPLLPLLDFLRNHGVVPA